MELVSNALEFYRLHNLTAILLGPEFHDLVKIHYFDLHGVVERNKGLCSLQTGFQIFFFTRRLPSALRRSIRGVCSQARVCDDA